MVYLILAIAIILNAFANILIKIGMNKIGVFESFNAFHLILAMFKSVYVLIGIISFAFALVSYSYVLNKINLSIAYPLMTSIGFILVVSFSIFFLSEKLVPLQILGLFLILTGVWLVASFR